MILLLPDRVAATFGAKLMKTKNFRKMTKSKKSKSENQNFATTLEHQNRSKFWQKKCFESKNRAPRGQTLPQTIKKHAFRAKPLHQFLVHFCPGDLFPILIFALWTIWPRQRIDLDLSCSEHFFWLDSGSDSVPNGPFCIFQFAATLSGSNKIL